MAITRTSWVDDDGSGTVGTVINNAEKTILYDQIDGAIGEWITPSFSAAEFVAEVGSWTVDAGDVLYRKYKVQGKSLFYKLTLATTSLSASSGFLTTKIPGGFTGVLNQPQQVMRVRNAPAYLVGSVSVWTGGATWLYLNAQIDGLAWAASTNNTGLDFSIVIEIV